MSRNVMALTVAALAFAAAASAAEFPLRQVDLTADQAVLFAGGNVVAELSGVKPKALKKAPKARSRVPLYGVLDVAPGTRMIVMLDEPKGSGYDSLILDLNLNGDLTDDPVGAPAKQPGAASLGEGIEQNRYGPILASAKKGPWQPGFYAEAFIYGRRPLGRTAQVGSVRIKPANYLEAEVEIDGVREKIGFVDGNGNQVMGDRSRIEIVNSEERELWNVPSADLVLRDRNHSGGFEGGAFQGEADPLASLIFIGGNPYTVALARDLSNVRIEPAAGELGELALPEGSQVSAVSLGRQVGKSGWEPLTASFVNGRCKAPAGRYRVFSCAVGGEGKNSLLLGSILRPPSESIRVTAGQSAALKYGGPIEIRASAAKLSRSARTLGASSQSPDVNISLAVAGQGGEIYSLFMNAQGQRPEPPAFRVVDETGKEVANGSLEYG